MKKIIIREQDFDRFFDDGQAPVEDAELELTEAGAAAVENLKHAIAKYYTQLQSLGLPREPYAKLWTAYLNPLREKLMGLP
jgi:hypothetical protein